MLLLPWNLRQKKNRDLLAAGHCPNHLRDLKGRKKGEGSEEGAGRVQSACGSDGDSDHVLDTRHKCR